MADQEQEGTQAAASGPVMAIPRRSIMALDNILIALVFAAAGFGGGWFASWHHYNVTELVDLASDREKLAVDLEDARVKHTSLKVKMNRIFRELSEEADSVSKALNAPVSLKKPAPPRAARSSTTTVIETKPGDNAPAKAENKGKPGS